MKQVGKPVTGIEFIGREKELALLMEYMKMGQSVVLVAPRRFGKTSLVQEAIRRLKIKDYYTTFVDVFTHPSLELLSSAIVKEVLKNHKLHEQFAKAKNNVSNLIQNLKLKTVINDFQFILGFADPAKNEWELISESIDFVDDFAKKHQARMLCAYDEFGDIKKFDSKGNLVKLFRSKIQQQTNTTYIFSGSMESVMNNMFVSSKSPFYRLTRIIKLGYMEKEPWVNFLETGFRKLNINISKDYPGNIYTLCKGHPYYTHLAFQQALLQKTLYGQLPDISLLKELILITEKDYLEKVWEDISGNKEYVYTVRAIAEDKSGVYRRLNTKGFNISRAINNLEGMGLLFRKEDGYFISDPFFEYWIQKNM